MGGRRHEVFLAPYGHGAAVSGINYPLRGKCRRVFITLIAVRCAFLRYCRSHDTSGYVLWPDRTGTTLGHGADVPGRYRHRSCAGIGGGLLCQCLSQSSCLAACSVQGSHPSHPYYPGSDPGTFVHLSRRLGNAGRDTGPEHIYDSGHGPYGL